MVTIRKMRADEVPALFDMALRAFEPDHARYGVYPPLLRMKQKRFLPPLLFGRTILLDGSAIGAAFVVALGKKGEIGSIFLDPAHQQKGYGRQAMLAIEEAYPKVRRWKLETLAEGTGLCRFYESLGYVKTGERKDPKSGIIGAVYEKSLGNR